MKKTFQLKYLYLLIAFIGLIGASYMGRTKAVELRMDITPIEQPPIRYIELTQEEMDQYRKNTGVNVIVRCNNINCPEKF